MMILSFSIFDTKSGSYHPPFFMTHVGQAVRACIDLGNDRSTIIGRHPADFVLVQLGAFDDNTGEFSNERVVHGHVSHFLGGNPADSQAALNLEPKDR